MHILPYMTTYMTVGIFSKKNKPRPFFQKEFLRFIWSPGGI